MADDSVEAVPPAFTLRSQSSPPQLSTVEFFHALHPINAAPAPPLHRAGGELAAAVHAHAAHGDPLSRTAVAALLRAACKPLFDALRRWILDGELVRVVSAYPLRYSDFFGPPTSNHHAISPA